MLKFNPKPKEKERAFQPMSEPIFTDEQFYVLDARGLCINRGFLSQSEVGKVNDIISSYLKDANPSPSKFPFFELDYVFMDIATRKWIVEACKKTVGNFYRLDHCVGIQQPGMIKSSKTGNWVEQGYTHGNIHGGIHSSQGSVFFNSFGTHVWSGHMTVGIFLTDQVASNGGFCYIPGSHKQANLTNGADIFNKVMNGNFNSEAIETPNLKAGDLVFFPENLMHGAKPMRSGSNRRVIYFKFVPGFLAWRPYEEIKHYVNMAKTELQRQILRPPYVASFKDDHQIMSDNFYRSPVE